MRAKSLSFNRLWWSDPTREPLWWSDPTRDIPTREDIEADIASLSADEKYQRRQTEAAPLWTEFIDWAQQVIDSGIRVHGALQIHS